MTTEHPADMIQRHHIHRFYYSKSPIYGITVYDRTTQCPAWDYGADIAMDEVQAAILVCRLNHLNKAGNERLDAYAEKLRAERSAKE